MNLKAVKRKNIIAREALNQLYTDADDSEAGAGHAVPENTNIWQLLEWF